MPQAHGMYLTYPPDHFCYTSYGDAIGKLQKAFGWPVILGAIPKTKDLSMSKKIIQMVAIAALTAAASVSAVAGDMNNALGGALGGVAGAALGGAVGGSTGAVIGGAVGGGAGGAVTSNRRERTG
ncbi:MAG TPA: glycine zipper domain-containing protein, partial [Paraburkholderia sp.]|nr:glycine zipper domain-containing protein [Paraburkholderia sp.]